MRRRILPAVVVPVLAIVGLTGCTASGTFGLNCEAPIPSGSVAASVKLHANEQGTLSISASQDAVAEAQRSYVQRAQDRTVLSQAGSLVTVNFAAFDSLTGELLSATPTFGTDSAGEMVVLNQPENPLTQGLECAAPGDTVSMVLPAAVSAIPLSAPDASLVVLAEVVEVRSAAAEGATRSLPSGFPAVVTDVTGRPGVVLPPQDAPNDDVAAVRIEGSGAPVTADNQVFGQVLTVGWDGQVQQTTWDGIPENFGSETQSAAGGAGFRAHLTGVPVGSQVVVITTEDGAPSVSVIDVLAVL